MLGAVLLYGQVASGQTCPPNIDFEGGNFSGWEMKWGEVTHLNGFNETIWNGSGMHPFRYKMISAPDTTTDFYGKFPRLCPNGSGHSIILGNEETGAQAESISYEFTVPTGVANFSLFFHYAVVLQDPSHGSDQQPRFRARVVNVATGDPVECVNFDFTASASLPGFQVSPESGTVIFKDWTPITIDLTAYAGQLLKLEFITSDCTLQGHFGYAYVDVSSVCNGAVSGTIVCEGASTGTLTAPFGFQSYTWYADQSFSSVISTAQSLVLTPPPTAGAVYPVALQPYPGFGCADTVFATITSSPNPVAYAGDDRTICTYESTQLGRPPEPGLIYRWEPASLLLGATGANPYTHYNLTGPTNFQLTVKDPLSGCTGNDEVLVTPVILDTAMTVSGELVFCRSAEKNTSLQVISPQESLQWLANGVAVPGATALQYDPRPSQTTTYFAEIHKQGCRDSTRAVTVVIPPNPVVNFRAEGQMQCKGIPVSFQNLSSVSNGDTLRFEWTLANGQKFETKNVTTIYPAAGPQWVKLKAISGFGCEDSLQLVFDIAENCLVSVPSAFSPNGDGLNDIFRPFLHGIRALHRFEVYDRWGNLVYRTREIGAGWDGKRGGLPMDSGVYVWLLEYDAYDRDGIILKGTVTLIR